MTIGRVDGRVHRRSKKYRREYTIVSGATITGCKIHGVGDTDFRNYFITVR